MKSTCELGLLSFMSETAGQTNYLGHSNILTPVDQILTKLLGSSWQQSRSDLEQSKFALRAIVQLHGTTQTVTVLRVKVLK